MTMYNDEYERAYRNAKAQQEHQQRMYDDYINGRYKNNSTKAKSLEWYEILDVLPNSAFETISASYRQLCKKYHPDVGGSEEKMKEINAAFDQAKKIKGV